MKRAFVALMLTAAPSWADESAKVEVTADTVFATEAGNTLEPPSLKVMQDKLSKKVRYGSLKLLTSKKLVLTPAPQALALPNGKDATLSVSELKSDVATLRVKVPPTDTTYKLGRTGSLYLNAGEHLGGELWLVVSPSK